MRKLYFLPLLSVLFPLSAWSAPKTDTVTVAGGCYWCLEAILEEVRGVDKVVSGFSGGSVTNPTYEQVCSGTTGHAEAVRITFHPDQITLRELLEMFFVIHDPTTLNRQGNDVGTQYRSAIFYSGPEQKIIAEEARTAAQKDHPRPIVTTITPLGDFYPAADYHQNYFKSHTSQPYCSLVISPKIKKFRLLFAKKLKS